MVDKPNTSPIAIGPLMLKLCSAADRDAFIKAHSEEVSLAGQSEPLSKNEAALMFEQCLKATYSGKNNYFMWSISHRGSSTLVGFIVLFRHKEQGYWEVGMVLRNESQGLGVGTQAMRGVIEWVFEWNAESIVWGEMSRTNIGSIRMCEKLNFCFLVNAANQHMVKGFIDNKRYHRAESVGRCERVENKKADYYDG